MELRHLRYFVAVAEEQNVTRAARRLHIAQPPLSRQIRDLEEEFGIALFERSAASLRLTDAGRVFLEEARSVLRRADEAVQTLRSAAAKKTKIHVGYAPSPTAEILSAILHAFREAAPRVQVILHELSTEELFAGLSAKRLQVALVVKCSPGPPQGLSCEKLVSYRVGVIVPRKHHLAQRRGVYIKDVLKEPLITLNPSEYPDYQTFVCDALDVPARKLRSAEECDGIQSQLAAVEAGQGIAITSEAVMCLAGPRFVFVRLKPAPRALVVGICYDKRMLAASHARRFIETARQSAPAAALHSIEHTRR
jgi:DNA-binding transcriptional LysR family regulator